MARRKYSDQNIIGFIKDGFKPMKRNKKKDKGGYYQYIVLRKKKRKNIWLGAYDDSTWNLIQYAIDFLPKDLQTRNNFDEMDLPEARQRLPKYLVSYRSHIMAKNCRHIVDGFCSVWIWDKGHSKLKKMLDKAWPRPENYKSIASNEEGPDRWIAKPMLFYCKNCPAYSPKR